MGAVIFFKEEENDALLSDYSSIDISGSQQKVVSEERLQGQKAKCFLKAEGSTWAMEMARSCPDLK